MEHVTQVKQGHGSVWGLCLAKMMSHSEDSQLKFRPCETLAKKVYF